MKLNVFKIRHSGVVTEHYFAARDAEDLIRVFNRWFKEHHGSTLATVSSPKSIEWVCELDNWEHGERVET